MLGNILPPLGAVFYAAAAFTFISRVIRRLQEDEEHIREAQARAA